MYSISKLNKLNNLLIISKKSVLGLLFSANKKNPIKDVFFIGMETEKTYPIVLTIRVH